MKNKINYFMDKDTRLVLDNLTKVIVNENILLVDYTIGRLNDKKITAIRYLRDKNRMLIYGILKKYNPNAYEGFVDWANEKGIEWYGIGKDITEIKTRTNEELEKDKIEYYTKYWK